MNHPILKNRTTVLSYFGFWLFVALIHAVALVYSQQLNWSSSILDSAIFNIAYSLMGFGLWYPCRFISLKNLTLLKILESHLFAAVFTSTLIVGLANIIPTKLITVDADYLQFVSNKIIWNGIIGILYYFVIISFYYLTIYSNTVKQQIIKEAELKILVQEAELRSLKFQINPHFIFNSLNSINSLTFTDPEKAGEMTIKLADYLRYTLSKNEQQQRPLKEELDSVKLYLEIEKVRFGDKIEFSEDIQECSEKISVPNMILQPLLENAIKHGVYESLEPVKIRLSCQRNGSFLKITLENTFDPESVKQSGQGIGLKNIKKRLEITYNHKNLLDTEKLDNLFKVNLFIPIGEN